MKKVCDVTNAIVELLCVLLDAGEAAWEAADLAERVREWWWVTRHTDLVDAAPDWVAGPRVNYVLSERQERVLELAGEFGRVTNAIVRSSFPLLHPETIRLDLCGLVDMGLLNRHGERKATYYVLSGGGQWSS